MKHLMLSGLLLLIILCLCISSSLYIRVNMEKMEVLLCHSVSSQRNNDLDAMKTSADKAEKLWKDHLSGCQIFLNHEQTEKITEAFLRISVCEDPNDYAAECTFLLQNLETLRNMERLTVENIL